MSLKDDLSNAANSAASPLRAFQGDPLQVAKNLLQGVDNGQRVPVTATKTSYGLTIHAVVGNKRGVIGAIHEIAPSQALQLDEEWEVNANGKGIPRELIPQILTGRTLALQRYDLYKSTLEQVFGTPELITLADQLGPVSVRFMWRNPNPSDIGAVLQSTPLISVYEFVDVYITALTRPISAGNIIVGTNATMTWRDIRRLQ